MEKRINESIVSKYKNLMMPLLKFASDGDIHTVKEAVERVAKMLNLSEEELGMLRPNGRHSVYYNNLGWAKNELIKAGCLERTGYARFRITDMGQEMLKQNNIPLSDENQELIKDKSTEEAISTLYDEFNKTLAEELRSKIMDNSFEFFEQLVIDLLEKMGYGKGVTTQPRKDGGVDGFIEDDPLGFGPIYTQAKRWTDSTVSTREMGQFIEALTEKNAHRGVFVTTSKIGTPARKQAQESGKNIVLIDGDKLIEYMIEYGLGMTTYKTYKLQTIDEDYFNN